MKFINNPFNTLSQIIEENYPMAKCEIYIGDSMTDGVDVFGCTLFPEETMNATPIIEIHYSLSIKDATEILAHELAHVIAGQHAKHNEEWERVFSHIHTEFQKKLDEQFTTNEEEV